MISFIIEKMEGWYVATYEIPGAFLQTDYNKGDIHIKIEGSMMNLLEDIDPGYYRDFIYTYICEKCIYAEVNTAIYGTIEVSLLFCTKLCKILEEMGYQRKKYGWCVMNKIVKGKQCTIIWHADDLKMSQVDYNIVFIILSYIDAEYGKITKTTILQGKIHK